MVYDGFLSFYICGYHHINSSNYSAFDFGADRVGLYNTYHVDDAVNVYIVESITSGNFPSAVAGFPWLSAPNNFIVLTDLISDYTIAHEMGHYFGLLHTHSVLYAGNTFPNCFLEPPSTNLDMVDDTPYDPGPTIACPNAECPTALTSCTLTCQDQPQPAGTVTYTYVGYFTDNVMSYHGCSTQRFTEDQVDRMKLYLNNNPSRSFLLNAQPSCNNGISELGFVNKHCQYFTPNPDITPIKDIRIDMRNEVTGWEGSVKKTKSMGEYLHFGNDYSNLSYVTIEPQTSHPNINIILVDPTAVPLNYHPDNGVDQADAIRVGKHITQSALLQPPYSFIAADVNTSGSITTFDLVSITRIIKKIVPDFPSGTWHYVPEFYFNNTNFNNNFPRLCCMNRSSA